MNLAPAEKVIKNWSYDCVMQGKIKATSTLTLTNRRLISNKDTKYALEQRDVPIDEIKSFSVGYHANSGLLWFLLGIALFAIAIILIVAFGVQSHNGPPIEVIIPSGIIGFLGFILICIGAIKHRRHFYLVVYLNSKPHCVAQTVTRKGTPFNFISFSANAKQLREICDTLGALMLDCKQ